MMEVGRGTPLFLTLVVLGSFLLSVSDGRYVAPEVDDDVIQVDHRRNHHHHHRQGRGHHRDGPHHRPHHPDDDERFLPEPEVRLRDRMKYDVLLRPLSEAPRDGPPLPPNWDAISRAAQSIGRTVDRYAGTGNDPALPVRPRDDDDDDDDADDDSLSDPGYQVELLDGEGADEYSKDEILKIEGTPAPALITSDDPEAEVTDPARDVMQGDQPPPTGNKLQPSRKEFKAVRMPTKFSSYDLDPQDGFITLEELVNVTGAKVNVRRAFNDSDKNGDGLLDPREFYAAPWKLGPDWHSIKFDRAPSTMTSSEEDEEDEEEDDEDYDDDDDDFIDEDDDDEDDEWDEWNTLDDPDYWDDVEDADIF